MLIEYNMKLRNNAFYESFSKKLVEFILYYAAFWMEWLDGQYVMHRNLKTSNAFVKKIKNNWLISYLNISKYVEKWIVE